MTVPSVSCVSFVLQAKLQTVNIDATEDLIPFAVDLLEASKSTLKHIDIHVGPSAMRPQDKADGPAASSRVVVFDSVEELRVTNGEWIDKFM